MPIGIYVRTEQHKKALRVPRIGSGIYQHKKGYKLQPKSEDVKKKISVALMGRKLSEETKKKMSKFRIGKKLNEETRKKISIAQMGEKSYRWNPDRGAMKQNKRNDPEYKQWVNKIKRRDGKCRLQNDNCSGYSIVHHILTWADYPQERYNIDNGIVLCQGHHPRKRIDEKRLVPVLQNLITNY